VPGWGRSIAPTPANTRRRRVDSITAGTLAQMDRVKAFLANWDGSAGELDEIRDRASAWVEFFKRAKTGLEAQNAAAEVKIKVERLMGEMLGEPPPKGRPKRNAGRPQFPDVDRRDASRLRKIAAVPEGELIAYFHTCNSERKEITSAGVVRLWAALNRKPKANEEVTKEVQPDPEDEEPVRLDFWKSAGTCRDEVRRAARKLKDVKLVLSGLVESPYKPLLKKAAHGDTAVALAWDGEEKERALIGATMVERVYTCPAVESLTRLVAGLELLLDREAQTGE